jgi:hypothetical protein
LQHPGHIRFFSIDGLSRAMQAVGYEVERIVRRNMYFVIGKRVGDPISGLLRAIGFEQEPRFATRDHFWQFSRLVNRASPFWTDTFTISAIRPRQRAGWLNNVGSRCRLSTETMRCGCQAL